VDEADEGLEESQITLKDAVSAKMGDNCGGGLVCNRGAKKDLPVSKKNSNSKFEMPPEVEGVKVLDPFEFDLFDIDTKEIKRRRSPK
jgi:hypothetical protein